MVHEPVTQSKFKFHAMAIAILCLLIVVLYTIIVPERFLPGDPSIATGDRFVRITTASWGLNCNPEIKRSMKIMAAQSLKKTSPQEDGEVATPAPVLAEVAVNNAMYAMSEICANRIICSFPATSAAIGIEPLNSCYKELHLGYRCYDLDRQWNINALQGDKVTIDCNESADKDRK